jgi:hypothetical protein
VCGGSEKKRSRAKARDGCGRCGAGRPPLFVFLCCFFRMTVARAGRQKQGRQGTERRMNDAALERAGRLRRCLQQWRESANRRRAAGGYGWRHRATQHTTTQKEVTRHHAAPSTGCGERGKRGAARPAPTAERVANGNATQRGRCTCTGGVEARLEWGKGEALVAPCQAPHT